ncbi:MAG: type II toxin-antitoxin system RelE/ParE family toxin [Kiritimatiellae bacterium]|nr:type II toxin-antitoxin system RelE/ParE family toxin [Kiritimatiellia bacterium]
MAIKRIYETEEVKLFAAEMSPLSRRKYLVAKKVLAEVGYLRAPFAEKIEGHDSLFAIRIMTDGNERFFYCYDDGDIVAILHGYSKTTRRIPQNEIEQALRVKNRIFGGSS